MSKTLDPVAVIDLNPKVCKFKDCDSDADWSYYNPKIHYNPVGICEECLGKMRSGLPYEISYYNCGRLKAIVEIEFRTDVPVQCRLFTDKEML